MIKKITRLNGECFFSLLLVTLGCAWTISGVRLGIWRGATPASGFFPLVVGLLLTVLSCFNFIKQVKEIEKTKKLSLNECKIVIYYICCAVACALAINLVGMFLTIIVGVILWFVFVAKYSYRRAFLLTLCIIVVIYAVFVLWLKIPFPKFLGLF